MKKKILMLILALTMILALAGCKKEASKNPSEPSVNQENSSEAGNETKGSEDNSEETKAPVDVTGKENLGKMYYNMPEGWELQDSPEGSALYQYKSGTSMASASIGFQEEKLYSADVMIKAYEDSIKQNIGEWDNMTEETIGDYKWRHYDFEDGTVQEGIYADVYLYSDGKNTLYYEFAATADFDLSQHIPGILESIVVQ